LLTGSISIGPLSRCCPDEIGLVGVDPKGQEEATLRITLNVTKITRARTIATPILNPNSFGPQLETVSKNQKRKK
jgi:hypothetical protein